MSNLDKIKEMDRRISQMEYPVLLENQKLKNQLKAETGVTWEKIQKESKVTR